MGSFFCCAITSRKQSAQVTLTNAPGAITNGEHISAKQEGLAGATHASDNVIGDNRFVEEGIGERGYPALQIEAGLDVVKSEIVLTEAELAELHDIFNMFDRDNSGSIDMNELESMVSSLGLAATNEDLNDMITEADVDHSGTIEFEEFKTLIGPHFQKGKPPEDLVDAFKYFDKDGDGYISRSELRAIMGNVDNDLAEATLKT